MKSELGGKLTVEADQATAGEAAARICERGLEIG